MYVFHPYFCSVFFSELNVGDIHGPYKEGNFYKLTKMVAKKDFPCFRDYDWCALGSCYFLSSWRNKHSVPSLLGFRLGAKDVFLNITGGISVDDPALIKISSHTIVARH